MKLKVSPAALNDLKEIEKYISEELCNPTAAKRTVGKIMRSYKKLTDAPFIGAPLQAKISFHTSFRYLVSGNYLIFYKVDGDFIEIYHIVYGKRDYIKLLFEDETELFK